MCDSAEKSPYRKAVLARISEYEKNGWWDKDVEEDGESYELTPDKVDYLNKKPSSKAATFFANLMGTHFFEKMIKKGQFIIKEITGIENFLSVKGGAVLTCNHFSICDNYAVWRAIKPYMGKKRLWKVIKEGNYTNPPKPFGFVMKNCNTLPLSRNVATMKKFISAVKTLLERGEKVLIYPEQSMWWNYRKPRPLQDGAFNLAALAKVPVIPVFITLSDAKVTDAEGYPVQEMHIHFLSPLFADPSLSKKENVAIMKEKNYLLWKTDYENFYKTPLLYESK